MQQGVWGCCKLWLKQFSNLLKPLEMVLFFGCDKWYSCCIIASNSCSHTILNLKQLRKSTPIGSAFRHTLWACISTATLFHLWLFFKIKLWQRSYQWKVCKQKFTIKTYVMKLNWCQFSQLFIARNKLVSSTSSILRMGLLRREIRRNQRNQRNLLCLKLGSKEIKQRKGKTSNYTM